MPIEEPGVVEILARDSPLQALQHAIGNGEISLQFLLSEVITGEIYFSIEVLDTAIPVLMAEARNRTGTHIPMHPDRSACRQERSHSRINKIAVCRACFHDPLHPGPVKG